MNLFGQNLDDVSYIPLPKEASDTKLDDYTRHWATIPLPLNGHRRYPSPELRRVLEMTLRRNIPDCPEGRCRECDGARKFSSVLTKYINFLA